MDRNSELSYAKTKGREEGKRETQIQVVKQMLKKDMEIKVISEITKLTIEEINQIKSMMN